MLKIAKALLYLVN